MALEARVDQRVDEGDQARAAAVLREARDLPVDQDLEARALGHVDDTNLSGGSGGHEGILARAGTLVSSSQQLEVGRGLRL